MDQNSDVFQNYDRFKAIMDSLQEADDAAIYGSSAGVSNNFRLITIDLGTAQLSTNPYVIGFPFRSFVVLSATDTVATAYMRVDTQDSQQDAMPIKSQTSLRLPFATRKAFLHWSAQSGKTMDILFIVRGDFSTNTLQTIQSGGVSISEGSAVSTPAVNLAAGSATQICAQDSSRKKLTFENETADYIYLGTSAVDSTINSNTRGIRVPPGGIFEWKNTQALYGYSAIGGYIYCLTET